MYFPPRFIAGLLAAAALLASPAMATDTVEVLFRNKPPYHYLEGDHPAGFLYDCVRKIFERAGVPARFSEAPSKRIVRSLQNDPRTICSFGWYKLDDRLAYARFSRPIYQDRPQVVIATPALATKIAAHRTLTNLMKDHALRLGVINGVSYGPVLDQVIADAGSNGNVDSATIEPLTLAAKVASGHVQFAFLDQDDFDYLKSMAEAALNRDYPAQGAAMKALVVVPLPDMPPGLTRHIMCTKATSADLIAQLDHAIGSRACHSPEDSIYP